MLISCTVNNEPRRWDITPPLDLAAVLRANGYFGVKIGCGTGECGTCLVLLDDCPIIACTTPISTVQGGNIITVEGLSQGDSLHPLQEEFLSAGAVQCGFCIPAMLLASKALLDKVPFPTEAQVRTALRPVLCRCTGYKRPVEAVLRFVRSSHGSSGTREPEDAAHGSYVGRAFPRIDGQSLVTGAPVFTDDVAISGILHGRILWSPHAHAIIRDINPDRALALAGVHAVLSYKNTSRIPYTRAGQEYPEPSPADYFLFDHKVRYVGDRVAAVAAESVKVAEEALQLIDVRYELLPAVFSPKRAMDASAPKIHDEPDAERIYDRERNICAYQCVEIGNLDAALQLAELEIEHVYRTHRVQHAQLEPHVCISYFGDDGRLTVRASTQVPFLLQRKLSQVLGVPLDSIRVVKPRVGGGFGAKQEIVIEDVCAALTLATRKPVRIALTRQEEFVSARCRHPMEIRLKTGLSRGGDLFLHEMTLLADAGAYGSHSPTVAMNTGAKNLPRYPCPAMKFEFTAAYTNNVVSGAFRGYGTSQGSFAIETQIDEIASILQLDPVEYRLRICARSGDRDYLSPHFYGPPAALHSGWEIQSANLDRCLQLGARFCNWRQKRQRYSRLNRNEEQYRRGIGLACVSQGSGVAGAQQAAVRLQLTPDGAFLLSMESGEMGSGSETGLVQLAAEILRVPPTRIRLIVGDTDGCPFSSGAYASGTTFLLGKAVISAATELIHKLTLAAGALLSQGPANLTYIDGTVTSTTGRALRLEQIGAQRADAGHAPLESTTIAKSDTSPPPFAAQFAEILVDLHSGLITVVEFLSVVDAGTIINPIHAAGQIEGAVAQGIGFTLSEEIVTDQAGRVCNPSFTKYPILRADEMPRLQTMFVEGADPAGPLGAKAVAEIGINGPAPAIGNALYHATGIRMRRLPLSPARFRNRLAWQRRHQVK